MGQRRSESRVQREQRHRSRRLPILLWGTSAFASLALAIPASAAPAEPYYLRNQNPFLQLFGVPAPEGGDVTPAAAFESRFVLNLANHADNHETANETFIVDGESYYADAVLRYGPVERWALGIDLPFVAHRDGALDNVIEDWHDAFGLSNSEREGPSNHLRFAYRRNGVMETNFVDAGGGIGDVRLTGAYQLVQRGATDRAVALRGLVKIPTGDPDRLRGSGGTDFAISVEATDRATLGDRNIALFGQAGVLLLGDGDVLADQQETAVAFAAGGLLWRWTDVIDLQAQISLQDAYFDSALDELGGSTANLTVGGRFHLRRLGLQLNIALIEDLVSDATPDFGMYVSISKRTTRRALH